MDKFIAAFRPAPRKREETYPDSFPWHQVPVKKSISFGKKDAAIAGENMKETKGVGGWGAFLHTVEKVGITTSGTRCHQDCTTCLPNHIFFQLTRPPPHFSCNSKCWRGGWQGETYTNIPSSVYHWRAEWSLRQSRAYSMR